jgi:two-component system sensor histidine kinase RegB
MIPISEESLKLRWLAGARWLTILGLFLAFVVGHWGLGFTFYIEPVLNILAIFIASNLALYIPNLPTSEKLTSLAIVVDVLLLTTFLYCYGGSTNPLSSVYFFYVILASILLPPRWGWFTAAFASICFGSLFFFFEPIPELTDRHHHHHGFSTHLQGMLITFTFTAFVIVYFVTRLIVALRSREQKLEALREKHRHNERLAGLTTLAAGAAHELRNPLATISISVNELAQELGRSSSNPEMVVEANSIQAAVGRCQMIIDELCRNAGVVGGEPISTTSIREIMEQLLTHLPHREMCEVTIDQSANEIPIRMFTSSMVQALLSVVRNGLEYGKVTVEAGLSEDTIRFVVRDTGPGIPQNIIPRLGEPFFTTKGAMKGMGLGLFITKTFADRLGGSLSFVSEVNRGTTAILHIPVLS